RPSKRLATTSTASCASGRTTCSRRSPARGEAALPVGTATPPGGTTMSMPKPRPSPPRVAGNQLWPTPNLLSLFRVALVPLLVMLLRDPGAVAGVVAAMLFVLGSLSD